MKTVVIAKSLDLVVNMIARECEKAGLSVVGKTYHWRNAVLLAKEKEPTYVVLGDYLPGQGMGAKAAEEIRQLPNPPRIVAYSATNWSFGDTGFSQEDVGFRELAQKLATS